jgi:DNA polymerase-3 subunit epsilon
VSDTTNSTRAGVRFHRDYSLADEAVALLESSPMPGDTLARRLFGLKNAPPGLTVKLLDELLGADPRVERGRRGVWRMRREQSGNGDAALSHLPYTVVDVETTGGMAEGKGRVIEIAAVRVDGNRIRDSFSTLIDPGVPISPWVSRLTGITGRMVSGAPSFRDVSEEIWKRLEGRVFVAHNVGFDWRFVAAEMRRARSVLPSGPRLCTVHLARRVVPGLRRRGLGSLAHYYGVEIEDRHRALGDAAATAAVLLKLLADAEREVVTSGGALQACLTGSMRSVRKRAGRSASPEREG